MNLCRTLTLCALTVCAFTATVSASVPMRFTVQGILRDGSGALQSMQIDVVVRLYNAETGGSLVAGPYGPTSVMAASGLFTLSIPDAMLKDKLLATTELWLEVSAGADVFARQAVTAQLYSVLSAHATDADHALSADALSSSCAGCITSLQLAPESVERSHIKPGALDHNHPAVITKTAATTSNIFQNTAVTVCSPSCVGPALVVSGSCTQTGVASLIQADVDLTNQRYCCRWDNNSTTCQGSAFAVCLAIADTTLP